MKKCLFSLLLIACYSNIFAQISTKDGTALFDPKTNFTSKETVRIHLMFRSTNVFNYRLRTTLNENKPITLEPSTYTVLETNQMEIGFFRNNEADKLPVLLTFEKGKDYFFRITRNAPGTLLGIQIDELTENAFKMDLFANDINPNPNMIRFEAEQAVRED